MSMAKLFGMVIRRTPISTFTRLYGRLLEQKLILPWGGEQVHPLELVHLGGGSMQAAADEWRERCGNRDRSIVFEQLCRAHSIGSTARNTYDVACELNRERSGSQPWQIANRKLVAAGLDELCRWLESSKLDCSACVYCPDRGRWIPMIESDELFAAMRKVRWAPNAPNGAKRVTS